jgi:hypothetical protein
MQEFADRLKLKKETMKLIFLILSTVFLLISCHPPFSHGSGVEESLGFSRLQQSLNKRIITTPNGTWTERTAKGTGISRIQRGYSQNRTRKDIKTCRNRQQLERKRSSSFEYRCR